MTLSRKTESVEGFRLRYCTTVSDANTNANTVGSGCHLPSWHGFHGPRFQVGHVESRHSLGLVRGNDDV